MKERRNSPRVDKQLPIKLSAGEYDILTETKNISSSGAFFPVKEPLKLMTKLSVVLLIPIKKSRSKIIKKITCTGIIVRSERVTENGKFPYRVAMFFSDLAEPDRKTLQAYVNYSLKN